MSRFFIHSNMNTECTPMFWKTLMLFCSLALGALGCPFPSHSAIIEGAVLSDSGLIGNSSVHAYRTFEDLLRDAAFARSPEGARPGFYRLELPPGKYFLAASGMRNGKEYFSFHGANPIELGSESERLWLPFMAVPRFELDVKPAESARISGLIVYKGRPVSAAHVSLYSPLSGRFRGMGLLTSTTTDDGSFRFSPEPGEYVIIARKRMGAKGMVPLGRGDLFCYSAVNPVTVAADQEIGVTVPCYPKDDVAAFLNDGVVVKRVHRESERFREKKAIAAPKMRMLSGRVTDAAQNPMKNLYVMAYAADSSALFQMHFIRTLPDQMVKTDEQGGYRMEVEPNRSYYLVARERPGEAPYKGERYGLYEGNVNHRVVFGEDAVTGIDIVAGTVMMEEGRRGAGVENRERQQAAPGNDEKGKRSAISLSDAVIEEDTRWDGDVLIRGTVLVRRGATLRIMPGTTVRFMKVDRNDDGIGDGEIRVLGRLIADGAPGKMIRFTSAEQSPMRNDWSYVLLFTSGDDNIVAHCLFEYAFAGLQAHFSKAVVADSIFRNNREGIRFGRAELLIEHNDIVDNTFGIRHTRLEGPVDIRYNMIQNNEVGIFFVPSSQNTQDFFGSDHGATPRPPVDPPVVRWNNISDNSAYNYRLGERQGAAVTVGDNWWGATSEKVISSFIYDGMRDRSLGKVLFKPYRRSPVKAAGARREGA